MESTKFIDDYGNVIYIRNDKIQFLTILANGVVEYESWKNDHLHRVDGPAIESANGGKFWYLNGKNHRIDGPAVEWASGFKVLFLDGYRMAFETWKVEVRKYYETDEDYLLMLLKW